MSKVPKALRTHEDPGNKEERPKDGLPVGGRVPSREAVGGGDGGGRQGLRHLHVWPSRHHREAERSSVGQVRPF